MKPLNYLLLVLLTACSSRAVDHHKTEYAGRVTIIRDNWGIPHIYGKTDADAVFGVMYAQCEESFERVERAYIEKLGRMAELEGKAYLYQDLRNKLLYDTARAVREYDQSPAWLRSLLDAFSAGVHYYLQTHPGVKPRLIQKFEPWFPLLFSDGAYIDTQTGGLGAEDMKAVFGQDLAGLQGLNSDGLPTGSNGFAIAPSRSKDSSALLFINPHVSFYFRTEMHMVSEEGLNAYGAVTWGQFFVFQGFNEHCGWMHTSTAADASDLYAEELVEREGKWWYRYNDSLKPLREIAIKTAWSEGGRSGNYQLKSWATHHGPIVGKRGGRWLSLKAKNHSLDGLVQSWQRMKARNMNEFVAALNLRANSSTNTLYADGKGNIAYWHGNFMPRRPEGTDPSQPLDGTTAATEWKDIMELNELVHIINPSAGFIQNCNSSPFHASGYGTIKADKYRSYQAPDGENFRSLYALRSLSGPVKWDMESLATLGYDTYLAAFDTLLPPLLLAAAGNVRLSAGAQEAIDSLRYWDRRSSIFSVTTTVAIFWAYTLISESKGLLSTNDQTVQLASLARTDREQMIPVLERVLEGLSRSYGNWKIPWGSINRFQRISGSFQPSFDPSMTSYPSPLGPAFLGSLPSYETTWKDGRQWGLAGNSFVAVVSFGKRVRAMAISTGGQSFDPSSPHFTDQVDGFLNGKLRKVHFYKEEVDAAAKERYEPGERGTKNR